MTGLVKLFITIVIPLSVFNTVNAFQVTDCSSKDAIAKLDKVTIGGCPVGTSDQYCHLVRGQEATIDIDFETSRYQLRFNHIKIPSLPKLTYISNYSTLFRYTIQQGKC